MSGTNGAISESAIYDSFGNKITSNLTTRYQYTGREYDEYTGLMFYRARFYDPQIGRFTSEDPIGLVGGVNLYSYVENKAVRFADPYGLEPQQPNTGKTPNQLLAECYKNALDAYDKSSNLIINVMKWAAPTNAIFGAGGGIADGWRNAPLHLITQPSAEGVTYRVGPTVGGRISSSIGGGIRGAAGGGTGRILGAFGVGFAIGLTGVVIGDSVIGREAFLRDAIKECNCGSPNATNKIDPSFFQLPWGGGNYGAAQTAIGGY